MLVISNYYSYSIIIEHFESEDYSLWTNKLVRGIIMVGEVDSMNLESAISITLKELRNQTHLSQEKLAHQCGVDRTYISLLECGKRKPTLHILFKICNELNVQPSEFIKTVEELCPDKLSVPYLNLVYKNQD